MLRSLLERLRSGAAAKVFGLSIANAIFGLATATSLARLMGPHNFGGYNFLLALLAIVSFPIGTGLRQVVLRETAYAVARPDGVHPYHIWRWGYQAAILLCVVVLAGGFAWGAAIVGVSGNVTLAILLAIILITVPVMHVGVGAVQGMGMVVVSQIPEYLMRPIGILVVTGIVAIVTTARPLGLETALGIYAAISLVCAGAAMFWLRKYTARNFADRPLGQTSLDRRALTMAALSFGMIQSVQLITDNVDTLMLGFLTTTVEVAHYRVAAAIATLASFAIIAINTVISPEIARLHALGARDELQRLIHTSTRVIVLISLVSLVAILVAGHLVLMILFGSEYSAAAVPLYTLSIGRFVASCFGPVATVLSLTGHERLTLAGLCASALCNVALNPLFIPLYGATGAALSSGISMIVWGAFLWVALRKATGFTTMFALRRSPAAQTSI
ncbi:MAG: polysaccharide biosynthesis C-terminal domain-containing protein [Sphingomonas sp.]|uniref:oligosaccharide flippase family protein n=1 Tax=Sphingomonas sp. TaxID=28214 RepID=UPI0025E15575|nr:polysaccharide biosynthesis C-terminal domain-containing protein [Sphingomonas sp.]MBX3565279.1 polysaccharide biosynthesis C-terminal domain-containing protein [Sphingomonas sp.]